MANLSAEIIHFLDRINRKLVQRTVVILKLLCVIGSVVMTSSIIYWTFANFRSSKDKIASFAEQTSPPPITLKDSTKPVSKADLQVIVEKNIFGPFSIAPTPLSTKPKPTTKSNLKLVGTYVGAGEASSAIIEDPRKGVQDVFQLNEMVFEGGKLSMIRSDRVEIVAGGQTEVLLLEEGAADLNSGASGPSATGEEIVVAEADVDAALANLPLLLTELRAVPYFKEGQAVGLRLFAIKSGSLFDKIGLKNGDILKSINENSLADFTQAIKLFEKLKTERSLKVQLERNKEEKTFNYAIR